MLKKGIRLFFFVFIVLNSQIFSSAIADTCKSFYESVLQLDTHIYPTTKTKNLGIYFDYDWDNNNQKKIIKRNENNFPLIRFSLFSSDKLIPGSVLKTFNSIDLSKKNDASLWNLILHTESAEIEFITENKIKKISLKSKEYNAVYFYLSNFILNSISEIEAKKGFFEIDHASTFYYERTDFNEAGKLLGIDECPKTIEIENKHFYDPSEGITLVKVGQSKDKMEINDFYSYNKGTWQDHIIEGVAKIKLKFNFSKFPFDQQKLHIKYHTKDLVVQGFDDNILFLITPDAQVFKNLDEYKEYNFLQEWKVKNIKVYSNYTKTQKNFFSDTLNLVLEIKRNSTYYLYKIIFPVLLILIVAWSVLWIPTDEIESRLTTSIVALLSLIAFNFVFQDDIPKLDILTDLDKFIILSYIFCAIPIFTTIFLSRFVEKKRKLASKRNQKIRISGGAIYILACITIFSSTL